MASEPEIIVHNREQLITLLTEAAEIEHGLMCCYLYAAFGLKTGDDSGLAPAQLEATRRWRSIILDVAIEEMLHFGAGRQPHDRDRRHPTLLAAELSSGAGLSPGRGRCGACAVLE